MMSVSNDEYDRLTNQLNTATERRGVIMQRFRAMLDGPIDRRDPIFGDWDTADREEREARDRVADFWARYRRELRGL